jgi:hypothetical protein
MGPCSPGVFTEIADTLLLEANSVAEEILFNPDSQE